MIKQKSKKSQEILLTGAPQSKLKHFLVWLGKQNAFLVIAAFALIVFGFHKLYLVVANGYSNLSETSSGARYDALEKNNGQDEGDSNQTDWQVARVTPTQTVPTTTPTARPTLVPSPTTDSDPIVDCVFNSSCNSVVLEIKSSECSISVCCLVEPSKYEILKKDECVRRQKEYNDKQREEYDRKVKEYEDKLKNNMEELDRYNEALKKEVEAKKKEEKEKEEELAKQIEELNRQNEELIQRREQQYQSCINAAKQKAIALCNANNSCDSTGYGSVGWIEQQEMAKCKR